MSKDKSPSNECSSPKTLNTSTDGVEELEMQVGLVDSSPRVPTEDPFMFVRYLEQLETSGSAQ